MLAGGFDHSYSFDDHDRYFSPQLHRMDDQPLPPVKLGSGYYSTTAITQHAIDMLAEHQAQHHDQPFFLYLAFNAPHFPLQALPEDIALYRDRYRQGWDVMRQERFDRMKQMGLIDCALSQLDSAVWPNYNLTEAATAQANRSRRSGARNFLEQPHRRAQQFQPVKMAIHAAMIHRMDIEIGRVLDRLQAQGVFDNTVIFFLSDNGASAEQIIRGDGMIPVRPGSAKTFFHRRPRQPRQHSLPVAQVMGA